MKKILILIFTISITFEISAQLPSFPQPNGNILNPSLDKFVGTWVWISGIDTLKIVLKKENVLLPFHDNSRADRIIGFHIFKKGNVIIEQSISYVNTNCSDKKFTFFGGNSVGLDNPNQITGSLINKAKNKNGHLKLLINSSFNELNWSLENREGVRVGTYDFTFSYPLSLTLTKQ